MEVEKNQNESKPTKPVKPAQAETPKAAQAESTEQIVYLGVPMIEGDFHINYGTIYDDGVLPEEIAARTKEDANFAKMFVPVSKALKALRELQNKDSDLSLTKRNLEKDYWKRKVGK